MPKDGKLSSMNLNDIKSEVANINSTIKTAVFGLFGFVGALAIALITVMI